MEEIACNVCGEKAYTILFSQGDIVHRATEEVFNLVQCNGCGFQYVNPRPTEDEIGRYYPQTYSYHLPPSVVKARLVRVVTYLLRTATYSKNGVMAALSSVLIWPANFNYRVKRAVINKITPKINPYIDLDLPEKILDIGCGGGWNTHIFGPKYSLRGLKRRGFETYGIETEERARSVARSWANQVIPSLFDNDWEDETFDVIRMNWSLEHVHDPTRYLAECRRLIKSSGRIITAIPNKGGILYDIFPKCVEIPVHLSYFTMDAFRRMVNKNDLRVVDYYTLSYPAQILEAYLLYGEDVIRKYSVHFCIGLQRFLDELNRYDKGSDMVFLLSK